MAAEAAPATETLLDRLSAAERARLVGQVLGGPEWVPLSWNYERLYRTNGMATGGIFRMAGTAEAGGETRPWSFILKVVSPAAWQGMMAGIPDDVSNPLYWKREVLVYESGWLERLPGGIRGPRCLAVETQPSGDVWLWLEEAQDYYAGQWALEQYAQSARCLGRFNGAYLAGEPRPPYAWLSRLSTPRDVINAYQWIEALVRDPATWAHPLLRSAYPPALIARLPDFWDARHGLLAALERMPQTLCHQDAWRGNVFCPAPHADEIVMIDWAYTGTAIVGSDPADLAVAGYPLLPAETSLPPADIDAAVFEAYMLGLAEAGWPARRDQVRFAYCTHAALKYGCLLIWLRDFAQGNSLAFWERFAGQPVEAWLGQQVRVLEHQLTMLDEALALLPLLEFLNPPCAASSDYSPLTVAPYRT
jgi:hypothetical protein